MSSEQSTSTPTSTSAERADAAGGLRPSEPHTSGGGASPQREKSGWLADISDGMADWRKARKEAFGHMAGKGPSGMEIGLSIVVGVFAGRWMDSYFDIAPYGTWLGLFFGVAAAAKVVIQLVKSYQEEHGGDEPPAPKSPFDRPRRD